MLQISPISDLRNYTEVLNEVDARGRVYLTRNGRGAYAIMTFEEAEELDRLKAAYAVVSEVKKSEERGHREGWVSSDEIRKEMGI
ncbi:MAG: hypothetical protein IJI57_16190 [Flexilinea sp.]|nr:hypothetical protein [Flexilinea sp.]